ncbi:thioesterase [Allosaccharopolyspora coralli]|uniref:Thioesterase n=1 Tax=Allosaccharopolyspora coralli TaxID=2665642 RepID=A0A5Q3Q7S3_9PSEU|nr:thioesterase family protein [Allosaccharopolyspora coralli]QGK70413.1 thioesterase [Allosaccharopolyspora coralli]
MTTIPEFRQEIRPEWIDYNGHLSEAYYVLVFGFATDALMELAGLDDEYRRGSGCSLYTVEARVRYLREVRQQDSVVVRSRVTEVGSKKLLVSHEMRVADTVVATEDLVALHVDVERNETCPFPDAVRAKLQALLDENSAHGG